jgi:hypothetical protein
MAQEREVIAPISKSLPDYQKVGVKISKRILNLTIEYIA